MTEADLEEVETYADRLKNTIAQYITTHPIMDLCLYMERQPGSRVSNRWWKQGCLDLVGAWAEWTRAEEAEEAEDGSKTGSGTGKYGEGTNHSN